ncbi:MAG: ATP-binding protein [Actinomycetota bacterium]
MSRPSQADQIVDLALFRYRFGRSADGAAFAVPVDGPPLARVFRGSASSLRSELAAMYHQAYGQTPNSSAAADALTVLEGIALAKQAEQLYVRVAERGAVWLDLGHSDGRFARVSDTGWTIEENPPVLFQHTRLTDPLPEPEQGGDLEELRDYLNLDEEQWLLVRGWLVAALMPSRPQPLLALVGRQGSGKSTIARLLVDLLDPSPAPLRSPPRNPTDWAVTAQASCVIALDNCSSLPDWLSDALCRAITGDGYLRRALYTDDNIAVSAFRRLLIINGIGLGALRGDLLDRAILLEPHPIRPEQRRQDQDLTTRWKAARGRILGGLLDTVARTLRQLPEVHLTSMPRMADHAEALAALDQATGTSGLPAYLRASSRALEDAIEGHPVALAVQTLMTKGDTWGTGTATELLTKLTPEDAPRDWPATPQHLSEQLRRAAPLLEEAGIQIETDLPHGDGHRGIRISKMTRKLPAEVSPPSRKDDQDDQDDQ